MAKYYWEDFVAGETSAMGEHRVTKDEIVAFAKEYDPQPFHVDEAAAKLSMHGGLIASGWHTCAMAMRAMCDTYLLDSASIGSPGIDNIRWIKPVRPGDTLRFQRTIVETRASQSKPNLGIVRGLWEAFNQDNELVMSMEGVQMFIRRTPANA